MSPNDASGIAQRPRSNQGLHLIRSFASSHDTIGSHSADDGLTAFPTGTAHSSVPPASGDALAGELATDAARLAWRTWPSDDGTGPLPRRGNATSRALDLFGRDTHIGQIHMLIDTAAPSGSAATAGGSLVVTGPAGIGKSALLATAADHGVERGMRVLTAGGVESEARLPFAGLHQLLRPLTADMHRLPTPQQHLLSAIWGLSNVDETALYRVALSALDLVCEAAASTPLLLIVDDFQFIDTSSQDALRFIARRLEADPIVLLLGERCVGPGHIRDGVPHIILPPLDEHDAGRLLDAHCSDLCQALRRRVLDEAAGNPLGLIELSSAGRALGSNPLVPSLLPLTDRLQQTFAARLSSLPSSTRTFLLVAALNDEESLTEALSAARRLEGRDIAVEEVISGVQAELIEIKDDTVRFRHPLIKSSTSQTAPWSDRLAAEGALAEVLIEWPDRRAWHLAASVAGRDEAVALEMELAAERASRRGAAAVAVAALERAAQLSESPGHRGRRLLEAAELAAEIGSRDTISHLVDLLGRLDLGPGERTLTTWLGDRFNERSPAASLDAAGLLDLTEQAQSEGDLSLALKLIEAAGARCWRKETDVEIRRRILSVADRLKVRPSEPQLVLAIARAAPSVRADHVQAQLRGISPQMIADGADCYRYAMAAVAVGDVALATGFQACAVDKLRASGRLALLAQVLAQKAWVETHLGNWDLATSHAEESDRLAAETDQPVWQGYAKVARGILAALRGDTEAATEFTREAGERLRAAGGQASLDDVELTAGVTQLAAGNSTQALQSLLAVFSRRGPESQSMGLFWFVGALAEAAAQVGAVDGALAWLEMMEAGVGQTASPQNELAIRYAWALLADDAHAEERFADALRADTGLWPFDSARLQLAYGIWLRRRRRVNECRDPLRTSRDMFDSLGAAGWSDRARQELRAAGEASDHPAFAGGHALTPQEMQIAQMAAQGMSNREIAQRLYLSHRTVGAHLYRTYPKLGIASRSQLSSALSAVDGK